MPEWQRDTGPCRDCKSFCVSPGNIGICKETILGGYSMISIIVCSTNADLLAKLRLNVEATIGTPYELLAFDNRDAKKGIAEVYNNLAGKAAYGILCFVHEDVIIHTKDWGAGIVNLLSDKTIGLVGISGAVYKSFYAGTWSTCHPSLYRTHSIQHFTNNPEPVVTYTNPGLTAFAEVAVIDGVYMATRKNIFEKYHFDAGMLKGFHGYDIDYSLQVGQQFKVVVSFELLLEHLSEGTLNEAWLHSSLRVQEKWHNSLPVQSMAIDPMIKKQSDYQSCRCVLGVALQRPGNKKMVLKYFCTLLLRYFSFNRLLYLKTVSRYLLNLPKKEHQLS